MAARFPGRAPVAVDSPAPTGFVAPGCWAGEGTRGSLGVSPVGSSAELKGGAGGRGSLHAHIHRSAGRVQAGIQSPNPELSLPKASQELLGSFQPLRQRGPAPVRDELGRDCLSPPVPSRGGGGGETLPDWVTWCGREGGSGDGWARCTPRGRSPAAVGRGGKTRGLEGLVFRGLDRDPGGRGHLNRGGDREALLAERGAREEGHRRPGHVREEPIPDGRRGPTWAETVSADSGHKAKLILRSMAQDTH